jgi:hemerythrin-like domain-containing protein
MTTATQNLENDHVQILRLIEVMERISGSSNPIVDHLELIVKVIREFADGLHHAKEEQFLFPLLVQKGFSNETGPVAVMLHDHAEGRYFVKGMSENISLYQQGDQAALQAVYSNMQGYTELLKSHIAKENNVLFRMADKAFSPAEQESLLLDFTKVDFNLENQPDKSEFIAMIDKLYIAYFG